MGIIKFVADKNGNLIKDVSTPDPIVSVWENFDPKDEPFSNYGFIPWCQHIGKTFGEKYDAEFIDEKRKCNCSMQMLMREGCKCGGE